MNNFQDNWNISYMNSARDKANAAYMKVLKNLEDSYTTALLKEFQDKWNVSYMKAEKDFSGQLERVLYEGLPRSLECIVHERGEEFPG